VMLELIRPADAARDVRLLDFGCGASHLYEYILARGIRHIEYSGFEISTKFFELSKSKFPANQYYRGDLIEDANAIPAFDYIVMNGVFTEKITLSFEQMFLYFKELVRRVFAKATAGLAFNVMSTHVDWERPDLFHLPLDTLASFLTREVSRNFVIRNDYGLYEYTTYIYR
jgi:SAM-dependent methyltransferase